MTDSTNQCKEHSGLTGCASNLKIEINDKLWPAIRVINEKIDKMLPRWVFVLIGGIVVVFGLLLIESNTSAVEKNTSKIECLQQMAQDVKDIKAVVVK